MASTSLDVVVEEQEGEEDPEEEQEEEEEVEEEKVEEEVEEEQDEEDLRITLTIGLELPHPGHLPLILGQVGLERRQINKIK